MFLDDKGYHCMHMCVNGVHVKICFSCVSSLYTITIGPIQFYEVRNKNLLLLTDFCNNNKAILIDVHKNAFIFKLKYQEHIILSIDILLMVMKSAIFLSPTRSTRRIEYDLYS